MRVLAGLAPAYENTNSEITNGYIFSDEES